MFRKPHKAFEHYGLSRIMTRPFQHLGNTRFRGKHNGEPVRPAVFEKEAMQIDCSVRVHQPWCRSFNKSFFFIFSTERNCECVDDFLKDGFARYGIVAFKIFPAYLCRHTCYGMRNESESSVGHSFFNGLL